MNALTRPGSVRRRAAVGLITAMIAVSGCGSDESADDESAPIDDGQAADVDVVSDDDSGSDEAGADENDVGVDVGGDSGAADVTGGTAGLVVGGTTFDFRIAHCLISDEDILADGPGNTTTADGTPAYFDIDLVQYEGDWMGEVRVDLGAQSQFESTDDIYTLTFGSSENASIEIDGKQVNFHGDYLTPAGATRESGTMSIYCE